MSEYLSGLPGKKHAELEQELSSLYEGCCTHESRLTTRDLSDDLSWIEELIKAIYEEKGMPEDWDGASTKYFLEKLWSGITKGYGADLTEVDVDSEDFKMLESLRRDVVRFSSAKDYQMQRAMTEALLDENGKLRTFSQFKLHAYEITNSHTQSWLQAEYDLSIASAQMASTWADIQENKELFPLLEYDAVIDSHTSNICLSLDGVKLPPDDHFWDEYYPPNHFNCRAGVKQQSRGKATDRSTIVYPDRVPAIFKVNLAKRGLAYPPEHPYYKGFTQ